MNTNEQDNAATLNNVDNHYDLSSDMIKIKDKLLMLQREYEDITCEVERKNDVFAKADEVIEKIKKEKKDELVKINIGGKEAQTYLCNLLNHQDSLFYHLILSDLKLYGNIRSEFFFDRTYEYFNIIINYLRTGILLIEDLKSQNKLELYEELQFYGLWKAVKFLKGQISINIVNASYSSIHASLKTNFNFKNLNIKNNSCGFGTSTTTNSYIWFELEGKCLVSKIEIASVINNKPSSFVADSGKNSIISTSLDNINYVDVGKIPDNYSGTPQIVKLKKSYAKFLKISNQAGYISIGYLVIS